MKNIFKQFEVWATNSKATNFKGAVIRLTAYYTLGVFVILLVFSFLVYGLFSTGIEEKIQEDSRWSEKIEVLDDDDVFFHEVTENLLDVLVLSDFVLLFLTVVVSYLLARKTLAPLALAYQKQQRFVADAAHELRTPLAVMKAGNEVLLRHERTVPQYKKFINESLEEVNRLIALSNDLLFLVQNKATNKNVCTQFSLSEVCFKQLERIEPYAVIAGISIHSNIGEGILLQGREEDISRVIQNLLKNAVDYNKPQGSVTLTLVQKKQEAILTLRDTGIGIEQKDIPYIFERFYKADSSRVQKNTTGSGLGLSIAEEIVTLYGGAIQIQSTVGEGTTFELRFPCV